MKIEELCQYLNELGILSLKNTPLFLSIYSGLIGNNKQDNIKAKKNNNIENNKLTIILFAFLKKIISNDKELYELCSNIIHSHKKNKLIKLYQGICFFNKIIFYQIKNRFNHFLSLLFTKKYPKRKYYPYNPSYAAKSLSKLNELKQNISFTNPRRINNIFNINEEYSLSYISNKNNSKHYNKIILNTDTNERWKSEYIPSSKRKNSLTNPYMPDLIEKMNNKKKEISMNNMKKKLYDAQTRINNYENIIPISIRNRKKEIQSKKEEDYYKKLKDDKIYQKLTEKEIDNNNILDRLYRKEIIKKQDIKRKEKEKMKRTKSPINWDKINNLNSKKQYLNININSQDINSIKEIINKPENNHNSSRGIFSFGDPSDQDKYKINQNDNIINNKNQINYNELTNNNKTNNIRNNNYINLKQLDENEKEENINKNKENMNEYENNPNEKNINIVNQNNNNPQSMLKYSFGKTYSQNNEILNKGNNNNESEEKEILTQNDINNYNKENQNENDYNLPQKFISNNNNEEKEKEGDEQEEELIHDNQIKSPNEQNDYQYNNNEEEEDEEDNNEEYQIENEEIECDIKDINNQMENDNNNINENEKIGNENTNYEEIFGDNIDEYLDEQDKEK